MQASSGFSVLSAVVPTRTADKCFLLGLGNRIARVVDRTRAVASVIANVDENSKLFGMLQFQASLLEKRTSYLQKAIRLGYAAVGGFAAEVLISVLGGSN